MALPCLLTSTCRPFGQRRRKPLIVRGTRQVGKTWLVEHVAAARFETMVKIDLKKRRDLHVPFGDNLDPKVIVQRLEVDGGRRIGGTGTGPGDQGRAFWDRSTRGKSRSARATYRGRRLWSDAAAALSCAGSAVSSSTPDAPDREPHFSDRRLGTGS